ncbi:MAG: ATP-binding protein [Acidimicrobiales bacterium]
MIFRRTFEAVLSSVTDARRFTASTLEGLPEDLIDGAILMVSELATNAVQHARSRFELTIDCDPDGVEVEVWDHGGGEAEPQHPSATDTSGRGLQIVGALADAWGTRQATDRWGKGVWFTLAANSDHSSGRPT